MKNTSPSVPVSCDPPMGQYYIFHHVYTAKGMPKTYCCSKAPEIKGAFVHFVSNDGEEVWISGNITIRKRVIS